MITETNQGLLTGAINCIGALVDGYYDILEPVAFHNVRPGLTLKSAIIDFLDQYCQRVEIAPSLPLLRAITSTIAILHGHSTCQVEILSSLTVFKNEDEIASLLTSIFNAMAKVLSTDIHSADEAMTINLITLYGLSLPLIPINFLRNQCVSLINQIFLLLSKTWKSSIACEVIYGISNNTYLLIIYHMMH